MIAINEILFIIFVLQMAAFVGVLHTIISKTIQELRKDK